MFKDLTRRDFIKTAALGFLAINTVGILPEKVFAADNCSVNTRYGTFNGFIDENGVKTWLGIPYAQPPVGKLRWQAPQSLKPSNKTFDAKKYGFAAMQVVDDNEGASKNPQSEDCLTLNIWTRGDKKNLPVMVFIHGGAFAFESASDPLYSGTNIATAHDVVVVNFNYRVNVFGFVNFASIDSSFEDSGYRGIKDQVEALNWVKENIAEFGGAKTMNDMMKKSAAELVALYEKVKESRLAETAGDYLPTCDGKFIPNNPFKALNDGGARGIKFLTGTTADEWRYWLLYMDNFFEIFRADPKKLSPVLQRYKAQTPEKIYTTWLSKRPDTEESFADFVNQVDWRVGQEWAAEYQSQFADVYYYLFSEQSPDKKLRSCHAVDLPFTFNVGDNIVPNPAQNLVKQVQASWTAFAATGNPNNEFIPHGEKYSVSNRQTMELNSKKCVRHRDLNTENLNVLRYLYEN